MMSGLMAKPLLLNRVDWDKGRQLSSDHVAVGQANGFPHPKDGAVLLLALISDDTAERASRNDHRYEKCWLCLGLAGAPRPETSGLRAGNTPRAQIVRFRVRPAARL